MRYPTHLLVALGLATTSLPAMAATAHTVPWYLANPGKLHSTLAACQADPGDLNATPDCINAESANKAAAIAAL
jgi:hypothetical protein